MVTELKLTGRFQHRKNIWGNLILYVEVSGLVETESPMDIGRPCTWWRKAKEADLFILRNFYRTF